MKKTKITGVILLCFVILLISCSKNQEAKTDNNNPSENAGAGESVQEKDPDAPDTPKLDFDGKTFTFFTAGWGGEDTLYPDLVVEEYNSEPINDAAYDRKIKIEQEYNCKIKHVDVRENDEAVSQYRTAILANDKTYDVGITNCSNFTTLLSGNYLIDFKELTYIDMDKPYWDKNFYESMAITGRHFGASGDISKRRLECVWIMCFNKAMINDNAFDSPYDLVKSGQWTFEKMTEMGKKVARNLDGSGKMNENDVFGLNYTGDTIMGLINGCGVKIAELNDEGIPELTIASEKNLEKLMKIYTETRDDSFSIDTLFRFWLGDTDIFSQDRCLFLACATHNINKLRELDVDFGIIPYPKWDEAQANYMPHTAGVFHPVITVPNTNGDLDATGIILEAMAYEGRKTIVPAFYDSLLKTKTARDEESLDMIDYIFGHIYYDVGNMYNFGEIVGTFGYGMSSADNRRANIVSTVEKNSGKWEKAINSIIEGLAE